MPKESSVGYQRSIIPVHVTGAALSGTGALNLINAMTPGFRFWIEKLVWVTTNTIAGAGGSQTFHVRKGGPTGTSVASVNPTVASQATMGTVLEDAVAAADEDAAHLGADTDTLSVTRDASGTSITGGDGILYVVIRQREQARK